MIPLTNYDFQASGEQWGRDEIYPDIMSVHVVVLLLKPIESWEDSLVRAWRCRTDFWNDYE